MLEKNFVKTRERAAGSQDGGLVVLLALAAALVAGYFILQAARLEDPPFAVILPIPVLATIAALLLSGLYTLQPNESAAILLFSNYKGTDRRPGLRWVPPWYLRKKVSVRAHNVVSPTLKVNDKGGSPIEIGAVVVWRVADTAQALFDVENYAEFVNVQIETALREIASHFFYDGHEEEPSLRANGEEVAALLRQRLQDRVDVAGVVIDEAKISHLAYAPEIAGAMLRRQQADAVLAARSKIVRGAVDMVEHALADLSARGVVALDDERRAAMVSNLLVVLCAEREAQPVVNAGTLYG